MVIVPGGGGGGGGGGDSACLSLLAKAGGAGPGSSVTVAAAAADGAAWRPPTAPSFEVAGLDGTSLGFIEGDGGSGLSTGRGAVLGTSKRLMSGRLGRVASDGCRG